MRLYFITVISLLGSVFAWSQEKAAYFTTEEMPDLVKCLPAPPAKGSPAFQLDVQRYKWGKQQRKDPVRAEMACRDAVWTYEALLDELDDHFGMAVSEENTPAIWNVLERRSYRWRPDGQNLRTGGYRRMAWSAPLGYAPGKQPVNRPCA